MITPPVADELEADPLEAPRAAIPGPARRPGWTSERLMLWGGPATCVALGAGLLIGGLIPPPSPGGSPEETVRYWSQGVDWRRLGLSLLVLGTVPLVGFMTAVAARLRRIEGPGSPAAAMAIVGAAVNAALIMVYAMVMLAVVFDLARPPEITQALTQVAWIPFIALWTPGSLQAAAVALAVLGDRSDRPLLPRWVGWFSAWYALGATAGALAAVFDSGPFAWNGFVSFYVEATAFFAWYIAVFEALRRSLRDERLAGSAG